MSVTKIDGMYYFKIVHRGRSILEPLGTSDLKEAEARCEGRAQSIRNEMDAGRSLTDQEFMARLNQWLSEAPINEEKLRAYMAGLAEADGGRKDDNQIPLDFAPAILLHALWNRVHHTLWRKTHLDELIHQIKKTKVN